MGLGSKLLYDTAKPLSLSQSATKWGKQQINIWFFSAILFTCVFFHPHKCRVARTVCCVCMENRIHIFRRNTQHWQKRKKRNGITILCKCCIRNVAFEMFLCDMITGFFYFYFPLHTSAVLPLDENKFWEIVTFCVHQIKDLYTHLLWRTES